MTSPKTAMVLAAGLGTRMRPLTNDRPKALVEVAGRALIDHALDRLVEAGVETAVVNVHAFADLLERLVFTPGRNAKLALLKDWFAQQPDPDRGVGLAALTDELVFSTAKPARCILSTIRDLPA